MNPMNPYDQPPKPRLSPAMSPEQEGRAKKLADNLISALRTAQEKNVIAPTEVTIVRPKPDLAEAVGLVLANLLGTYLAARKLAKLTGMSRREALSWVVLVRMVLAPMSREHYAWTRRAK